MTSMRSRLEISADRLVVHAPPHVSIKLRRVFGGAQRYRAGIFHMAATPQNAHELRWFGERHPIDVDDDARERYDALCAQHDRRLEVLAEFDSTGYVPREFELAIPPREYQRANADMLLKMGSLLIADAIGLGKTCSAIAAFTAPGMLPAIVVTMTHLARQWEREINRFAPKLRVHRVRSTQPYKFEDIKVEKTADGKRRVVRGNPVPDVVIITYSKLNGWADVLARLGSSVTFDEVQELRHPDTRKYEAAVAIAGACDTKCGLSATPIFNYGGEIYSVIDVLAPQALGTRREFFNEWCGGGGDSGLADQRKMPVSDPAALGTYLRSIGLMTRRTREDVGRELPDLTVVKHAVECDPASIERATADVAELARRVLARIGTGAERMQEAGELDWKLRQATGIAKAGAVADFVRMLVDGGEKVVVACWHRGVYDLITSHFSRPGAEIEHVMYTGSESDAQKDRARREFVEGDAQVLLMSLRSGAGLDGLQEACSTVVIAELDWSPKVMEQLIGRVHRDGQKRKVVAYYLVAEEGSDPVISDVLGLKEAQSQGILDPDKVGDPTFVGRADDHIRKLAEDVIRRREATTNRRTA